MNETVRAAAFQFDVRTGDVAANLATVEDGLRAAASAGVALVVLPEMWPTSFPAVAETGPQLFSASDAAVARVAELSRELALVVCGSAFGRPGTHARPATAHGMVDTDATRPTNRLHVIDRGVIVGAYDKVHLFTPTAEDESFRAGDDPPPVVATSVGRIGAAICYDLRFPELVRTSFRAGAEILVVPAQWPVARAAHWTALLAGRAVESQAFVVGANRTGSARIGRRGLELEFPGNSRIVDCDGATLATGEARDGLVTADIDLTQVRRLRTRVPIAKDERPELYARWRSAGRSDGGGLTPL